MPRMTSTIIGNPHSTNCRSAGRLAIVCLTMYGWLAASGLASAEPFATKRAKGFGTVPPVANYGFYNARWRRWPGEEERALEIRRLRLKKSQAALETTPEGALEEPANPDAASDTLPELPDEPPADDQPLTEPPLSEPPGLPPSTTAPTETAPTGNVPPDALPPGALPPGALPPAGGAAPPTNDDLFPPSSPLDAPTNTAPDPLAPPPGAAPPGPMSRALPRHGAAATWGRRASAAAPRALVTEPQRFEPPREAQPAVGPLLAAPTAAVESAAPSTPAAPPARAAVPTGATKWRSPKRLTRPAEASTSPRQPWMRPAVAHAVATARVGDSELTDPVAQFVDASAPTAIQAAAYEARTAETDATNQVAVPAALAHAVHVNAVQINAAEESATDAAGNPLRNRFTRPRRAAAADDATVYDSTAYDAPGNPLRR